MHNMLNLGRLIAFRSNKASSGKFAFNQRNFNAILNVNKIKARHSLTMHLRRTTKDRAFKEETEKRTRFPANAHTPTKAYRYDTL